MNKLRVSDSLELQKPSLGQHFNYKNNDKNLSKE